MTSVIELTGKVFVNFQFVQLPGTSGLRALTESGQVFRVVVS
jgi:acetoacetate decarboxylase